LRDDQPPAFTHFDAALWSAGTTFALILTASLVHGPAEQVDMVKLVAVQLAVYLSVCALFSWRRPGRNFSELFALRRTSPWLLLLGLLLGPALFGPAETMGRLVEHFAPQPPAELEKAFQALMPKSPLHGALLLALVAVGGPLVEELLFRGAIYTALRPAFTAGSAVMTAALCFTLSHPKPRVWPQVMALALILSLLRARSGSLWPGYLAHASFNAAQLVALWALGGKAVAVPLRYEIAGWALCAVILAASLVLARKSPRAEEARAVDEVAPPAVDRGG
jgi:membrane protease YdiL (CAAX protease family)